jgi:hypothetical protein
MLHEVSNPFIRLYLTTRERLQLQHTTRLSRVIFNSQMRLVLEAGADRRRENLPTSGEVAVIIPDEYGDPSCRDIVLAERSGPAGPDTLPPHRRHPRRLYAPTLRTALPLR